MSEALRFSVKEIPVFPRNPIISGSSLSPEIRENLCATNVRRHNNRRDRGRLVPQLLGDQQCIGRPPPQLLGCSFQKARNFTESSHPNAGFSIWVFKKFSGGEPPNPHSGRGGAIPSRTQLPCKRLGVGTQTLVPLNFSAVVVPLYWDLKNTVQFLSFVMTSSIEGGWGEKRWEMEALRGWEGRGRVFEGSWLPQHQLYYTDGVGAVVDWAPTLTRTGSTVQQWRSTIIDPVQLDQRSLHQHKTLHRGL